MVDGTPDAKCSQVQAIGESARKSLAESEAEVPSRGARVLSRAPLTTGRQLDFFRDLERLGAVGIMQVFKFTDRRESPI